MKTITRLLVAAALMPLGQAGAQNTDRDERDSTKTSTNASASGFAGGLGGMFVRSRRGANCDGCSTQLTSVRGNNRMAALLSSNSSHASVFIASSSDQFDFTPGRRVALLASSVSGSGEASSFDGYARSANVGVSSVTTSFSSFAGTSAAEQELVSEAKYSGGSGSSSISAFSSSPAYARTLSSSGIECAALDCVPGTSAALIGGGIEEQSLFGSAQPLGAQSLNGDLPVTVNPEPSTVLLTVAGLAGIFFIRRRVSSGQ